MDDRSTDATVEEFLELEQELTSSGGGVGGTYEEGTVAAVSKVPAAEVPEGYPAAIDTTHALHVEIDTVGSTVPVFLEWPDEGETSDQIDGLLAALGRDPREFAGVYGDRVALSTEDGWHTIDVERTATFRAAAEARADGSLDRTKYGVMAAIAVGVVPYLLLETTLSWPTGLTLLASWVAIPTAMYLDVERVRERLDWDTQTSTWLIGGLLPMVNVAVGAAYLVDRHVQTRGLEGRRVSETWYRVVLASIALPVVAVLATLVHAGIGTLLFVTSMVALPIAIYFDAEYVEAATDWDPREGPWVVAAAVSLLVGLWWLVGLAYAIRRSGEVP